MAKFTIGFDIFRDIKENIEYHQTHICQAMAALMCAGDNK